MSDGAVALMVSVTGEEGLRNRRGQIYVRLDPAPRHRRLDALGGDSLVTGEARIKKP